MKSPNLILEPALIPTHFDDLRALVLHMLENPMGLEWTLQGFGMLRTYLRPETRLHVWSPMYRVDGVSDIHTHPWDFVSTVICGEVTNHRYQGTPGHEYVEQRIRCGAGGGLAATPSSNASPDHLGLRESVVERYSAGESYAQTADEIHRSVTTQGTVTLCRRTFGSDPDHASVFWHRDSTWGSAEPRAATQDEIAEICKAAADRLSIEIHDDRETVAMRSPPNDSLG